MQKHIHGAFSSKDDVLAWLKGLDLEPYKDLFASAGYRTKYDLESLKLLKSDDLKKLGITKKGTHHYSFAPSTS